MHRNKLFISVFFVTSLIVTGCVFARQTNWIEQNFIYFPAKGKILQTPSSLGLEFEDVHFQTKDNLTLNGWYIPGNKNITILWFHGNAGNMGDRVSNIAYLHRKLNVNIFIFDYRGYGLSEGTPSEHGTYLDGDAAIEYLTSRKDISPSKIVFFGRSLGCSVAIETAIKHKTYALILESGFPSVNAVTNRLYPFLPGIGLLTRFFIKTKYDSTSRLTQITTPIMIIHGDSDTTIPYDIGLGLYKIANHPKRFYSVSGGDHNNTYLVGGEKYYDAIAEFLSNPTEIRN